MIEEWVLISPHRAKRPWSGQLESLIEAEVPEYDASNPLCPGSTRASGAVNDFYQSIYVFNNDFPAIFEDSPSPSPSLEETSDLFRVAHARGVCRVLCFHPKSNLI